MKVRRVVLELSLPQTDMFFFYETNYFPHIFYVWGEKTKDFEKTDSRDLGVTLKSLILGKSFFVALLEFILD